MTAAVLDRTCDGNNVELDRMKQKLKQKPKQQQRLQHRPRHKERLQQRLRQLGRLQPRPSTSCRRYTLRTAAASLQQCRMHAAEARETSMLHLRLHKEHQGS